MDEVSRYRKLARSGPISGQVIKDGAALHCRAMRELEVFVANEPHQAKSADALMPGLELNIFLDCVTLISAMQGLATPSQAAKKLLQDIFPVYAQHGITDLVKVAGRRLSGQFSPDFTEDLEDCRAVRKHLDELTFTIILEALYRNKLMPIKTHLWESAAHRVGLDAAKRAKANLDSIKR